MQRDSFFRLPLYWPPYSHRIKLYFQPYERIVKAVDENRCRQIYLISHTNYSHLSIIDILDSYSKNLKSTKNVNTKLKHHFDLQNDPKMTKFNYLRSKSNISSISSYIIFSPVEYEKTIHLKSHLPFDFFKSVSGSDGWWPESADAIEILEFDFEHSISASVFSISISSSSWFW